MASGSAGTDLWNQLNTLTAVGAVGGLSDGQLLQRLVTAGDATAQAIFTVLVERHGPMVLSVCRQVLGDPHDAQDAFQATFLVFARKAGSIKNTESAASWLYGVALRVAVRARGAAARRRTYERRGAEMKAQVTSGGDDRAESWPELHEEIARLPAHYREPIVLCYLEGLSAEMAAERLGCARGTILSRLSRAREQLRGRLLRRGLAAPAALLAAGLAPETATAAGAALLPPVLLDATVRASLQFAGRRAAETTLASAAATAMARGALHAMTISKLKVLGAAALACAFAAGGVQSLAQPDGADDTRAAAKAARQGDNPVVELKQEVERLHVQLEQSTRKNEALRKQLDEVSRALKAVGRPQANGSASAVPVDPAKPADPAKAAEPAKPADPAKATEPAKPADPAKPIEPAKPIDPAKRAEPASPPKAAVPVRASRAQGSAAARFAAAARQRGEAFTMPLSEGHLFVASPEGDRAVVFNPETNKTWPVPSLTTKEFPLEIRPMLGFEFVALELKGPKVVRLAALDLRDRSMKWYTQDLREPVTSASPHMAQSAAVYTLGRFFYGFSSQAKRWDVLELPEGVQVRGIGAEADLTYEGGGHMYRFNIQTGEWKDVNLNSILNKPASEEPVR